MKKSSFWLLVVVGTIAFYALFVMLSDISSLIENLSHLEWNYVFLAISVVFIGLFIRAIRWFVMIRTLKVKIGVVESIMIYFSGTAFGLTPGRLGEVMKSHYLKKLTNTPLTTAGPTIIVERILDVFAILLIASNGSNLYLNPVENRIL